MDISKHRNYYEVLEVSIDSTESEIHQGYTRAKGAYSQDSLALYSLMTQEECDTILNVIEEAYSILADPDKRRQYDGARGFSNSPDHYNSYRTASPIGTLKKSSFNDSQPVGQKSMSKIMANKRYQLDYEIDDSMEKEIEETEDFTGAFLKKIREYKNVTIPRLSDMTKVSKTYLLNIEEENLDGLPSLAYVRGFVYQFAKCIKLNPDEVATSYLKRVKRETTDDE